MLQLRQRSLLAVLILALSTLAGRRIASAQAFSVGSLDTPSVPYGASGIYTLINDRRATQDGDVRAVTLLWSEAPCGGAVKIKQFRRIPGGFQFIAQRGPFDITGHSTTFAPNPALHFVAGDVLALTVLTACGSPMIHAPAPDGAVYPFGGDLTSDVFPPNNPPQPTASLNIIGYDQTAPSAQTVTVGLDLFHFENVDPREIETIVELTYPANVDGRITTATFGWSASPCPAAVSLKFFRPSFTPFLGGPVLPAFSFVTQRGPFDVNAPGMSSGFVTSLATQTVVLNPPVEVKEGDVVAITNLTSCGGPIYVDRFGGMPPPPGGSLFLPGDVTSSFVPRLEFRNRFIFLTAAGSGTSLELLNRRFVITLVATDPRTGATTIGVPTLLGRGAGYFSLPDFTGDPTFPEVTVKMVDATAVPAPGGGFWFFHAPLTDVHYELTVTDQFTGAVKTYSNTPGASGQLCGGADTSAFPSQ
jgi:hypothetical protein